MSTPVSLPIHKDIHRCKAFGLYEGDTCFMAESCARFLTIPHDQPAARPLYRACNSELMSAYIPITGFQNLKDE